MTLTVFVGWAVALAAPPAAPATPAEERAALFRADRVVRLDLTVDKKDIQALRDKPREHVPCVVREDGRETFRVGVHLRGATGSFRGVDDKPGLTLNTTKLPGGRPFHGMTKFSLVNCVQDPTYVQELVCGELFRAAGVPAARVGHAVVTLNGRPLGVYCLKEGYDKGFLREHFRSPAGNLYDGGFLRDIDQPLERMSGPGDGDGDHADLKALAAAAREPDHAKRLDRVGELLELDRFLTLMAIDAFSANWDGYPAKANNYRVYHDPKTGKITFIPSGMDQMFGDPNYDIFAFGGLVARGIIDTKRGREMYLTKLRTVMAGVKPDELRARLKVLEARVRPALTTVDRGAGENYPNQMRGLRDAIDRRVESVGQQLKRAEAQK